MKLRALFTRFVMAVVLTACQSSSATISDDRLGRFVRDLVYGEDFALNRKNDRLQRWKGPIKVAISDNYTSDQKSEIEVRMRLVSVLTGISVEVSKFPTWDANFRFHLVAEKDFLIASEYVPCFARISSDGGIIEEADVIVSSEGEGYLELCLNHEIMHAMGFPNHSPIAPSTLSPLHKERNLTPWDSIALRVLYDRRLKPDMTEAEAMPIVRGIVHELRRTATEEAGTATLENGGGNA